MVEATLFQHQNYYWNIRRWEQKQSLKSSKTCFYFWYINRAGLKNAAIYLVYTNKLEGYVITKGFAIRNESGDVIFPEDQKGNIINIAETNSFLDEELEAYHTRVQ